MTLQDAEIKLAKLAGKYDECGIIKPHGESIAFKKKEVRSMSLCTLRGILAFWGSKACNLVSCLGYSCTRMKGDVSTLSTKTTLFADHLSR